MKAAAAFAIIHFVWQGAAIGAVAWLGFAVSRSPRIRYFVGIAALALMVAAPLITGAVSLRRPVLPSAAPEERLGGEGPSLQPVRLAESQEAPASTGWRVNSLKDPRLTSMVLTLWLVGVALLSARLAFGWLGARRLTQRVTSAGAGVQAIANQLIASLRLRTTIRIVESALVKVPAVVGAFKPVVLLPAAAMSGLSMEQVEALLAHELAHVRRHDYLVNLLQSAIETLLFYHPAVWLVSRRVRQERELCCDDLALAVCGDRVAYASALADLESLRAVPSPALAATGGSLLARVRRILGHDDVSALAGRSQSLAGVAILASIVLLAGGQAARARAYIAPNPEPEQIVEPDGTGGKRAPNAPQIQGPVIGVQGGVVGGVAGGVTGGVAGGVTGGIVGGVQGGLPGSRVVAPNEELIVDADNDRTRLEIGNAVLVWVRTPVDQPEFSERLYTIDANGNIALPHVYGLIKIGGLEVGDARALIRKTLIDQQQYMNPSVEMSIVRNAEKPKEVAPEPQAGAIGPFRIGDNIRIDVGDPRSPDSFKFFTTIPPDGLIATDPNAPGTAFAIAKLKVAGETSATVAAIIADRYRVKGLAVPPIEVTLDDRAPTNVSRYERRVSAVAQFSITGRVKNPGKYDWEEGLTLEKALAAAGGVTPLGAPNRIIVRRKDPKTGEEITIKAAKMDMVILADDVIVVPDKYF